MAIQLDYELHPGLMVTDSYWIVGQIILDTFNETALILMLGYLSEDARNQLVPGAENPIDRRVIQMGYDDYVAYLSADALTVSGKNPTQAAYDFASDIAEPRGLATFFTGGVDV
ncbi:MAG: hypothetical protein WBV94_20635 [Blastocatellia bacterium]